MLVHSDMLDAAIEWLIQNATKLYICSEEPETYDEAVALALVEISINADTFTGPLDYYGEGEEILGRVVVIAAVRGTGLKGGSASHVALASDSELLCTVPCESGVVSEGIVSAVRSWCISIEGTEDECTYSEE